jgi:hypothetical protein
MVNNHITAFSASVCAALFLVGCGGGGSTNDTLQALPAVDRTFPAQTTIHGGTFTQLTADALKLPAPVDSIAGGRSGLYSSLSCPYADGGCELGLMEVDYSDGGVVRSIATDGTITFSLSSLGGRSTSMKLDSQWAMVQDPRGCIYSKPFQLPADIPLSVNYAYSTSGVSVTRTCPDGSSSTDTWYGRKFSETTNSSETTRWIYDAFDAVKTHSYQIAFSVTWNTTQNRLVNIMLVDIYDYKHNTGTLFSVVPQQ